MPEENEPKIDKLKAQEIDFNQILLWHVNRILQDFSEKVNENEFAQMEIKVNPQVKALQDSVDALEGVLTPFLDNAYRKEIKELKNLEDSDEIKYKVHETDKAKLFAKLKFSAIVKLMSRKGFLPTESMSIDVG